ncbi:MAG: hypothetical protein N3E46_04560 [Gemmataceae bacterium]|uniref:Uncharacterized protein n=1 Tax=Thermogemmata fonticola TaxID=2755323 RepID=A0A7V9ABG5_9BACT|nr:hypothetical protein [Thermogemmata fonticola]MBA2226038.1 hypothetical protein [Thermogemmata fonticola]MCX8138934.1 hypothetical protein [Gemmataceae bacterium]
MSQTENKSNFEDEYFEGYLKIYNYLHPSLVDLVVFDILAEKFVKAAGHILPNLDGIIMIPIFAPYERSEICKVDGEERVIVESGSTDTTGCFYSTENCLHYFSEQTLPEILAAHRSLLYHALIQLELVYNKMKRLADSTEPLNGLLQSILDLQKRLQKLRQKARQQPAPADDPDAEEEDESSPKPSAYEVELRFLLEQLRDKLLEIPLPEDRVDAGVDYIKLLHKAFHVDPSETASPSPPLVSASEDTNLAFASEDEMNEEDSQQMIIHQAMINQRFRNLVEKKLINWKEFHQHLPQPQLFPEEEPTEEETEPESKEDIPPPNKSLL